MLTENELLSLISLLDDDDDEVLHHVESKLLSLGKDVIPILESQWGSIGNPDHQQKIEDIIHRIQFKQLLSDLKTWYDSPVQDLLEGVCIIARYRYPELDKQAIINELDKIRLDIWLELRYELSSYEIVRIINNILYEVHGFKGNTDHYHDPQNSFINHVLESRKGNPIMMSVIYILIAQRLQLPIFGVNLPQHFVCAYREEMKDRNFDPFNVTSDPSPEYGRVLFYINAFNKGSVFSKSNLEQFLRQIKVEPRLEYFEACNNVDIVKRVLRNLVVSYEKTGKPQKVNDVKEMLLTLGEQYYSDEPGGQGPMEENDGE